MLLAVNKIKCGSYRFSFYLLPESNPHRRRNPGNFGGTGGDHRSSNHNLYNISCSSGRGHAPVHERARACGPASNARDPASARTPSHGLDLLEVLRWIDVMSSTSIPASSNANTISLLVTTVST